LGAKQYKVFRHLRCLTKAANTPAFGEGNRPIQTWKGKRPLEKNHAKQDASASSEVYKEKKIFPQVGLRSVDR